VEDHHHPLLHLHLPHLHLQVLRLQLLKSLLRKLVKLKLRVGVKEDVEVKHSLELLVVLLV
jgi:hypothetical protein